jgi:hypothetical protein
MKKILGICGDSFMASDLPDTKDGAYGKHFSEILSKMLDCDVVTFARRGISNFGIRLQMDEIVKYNPHHVIIGTTTPDRFEIPVDNLSVIHPWDKWSNTKFNPSNGIYNVVYDGYGNQSQNNTGFKNIIPTIYCQGLTGALISEDENIWITPKETLNKEMSNAVRQYFQYIYDMQLKLQQDTWIISEGTHMLMSKNIDFSLITPQIDGNYFTHCKDKIIENHHILNPWTHYELDKSSKNSFHVSDERSVTLAELWFEKLKHIFL